MPGQVILEVVEGNLRGKRFVFDDHDMFVFGRASDCHIQIPRGDATASRHHFILEANPPNRRAVKAGMEILISAFRA